MIALCRLKAKNEKRCKVYTSVEQNSHIDYFMLIEKLLKGTVESAFCDLPFNFVAGVDAAILNVYNNHNYSVHSSSLQQSTEDVTAVEVPPGHVLLLAGM